MTGIGDATFYKSRQKYGSKGTSELRQSLNLDKSLAKLCVPQGQKVDAVAPGPAKTAIFDQIPQSKTGEFIRPVFAKRLVEPDEVGQVIEQLATDAPEYVGGSCVDAAISGYLR